MRTSLNKSMASRTSAVRARIPICYTLIAIRAAGGFTLLEVVLVIGIMSALIALSTVSIARFQQKSDIDLAATNAIDALRLAEERARGVDGDAPWGVRFATGTITIFRGISFAARDSAYDEATAFNNDIVASGTAEYVFARFAATTTNAGTTTLTHQRLGESRDVGVNAKGTINY